MLTRVYIHNYKCLVNFELELGETALLLGPNGSGKTAVLDVVFGLRRLLSGDVKVADRSAFPSSTVTRWQMERVQVFELEADIGDEKYRYQLKIEHDDDGRRSRITTERLVAIKMHYLGVDGFTKLISGQASYDDLSVEQTTLFEFDMGTVQLYRDDGSPGPSYQADWGESALARVVSQASNARLTRFKSALQSVVVCAIRPHAVRTESAGEDQLLNRTAENFVDWYRHSLQDDPTSASSYIEALKPVIGGFRNLRLQNSGLDSRALLVDITVDSKPELSHLLRIDELSDGQRSLIVLYALLHLRPPDAAIVLFLDEPDNFVALPEIQPWLVDLVEMCEDTGSQAVICSHHPELIDYLGPENGVYLRRVAFSATVPTPVSAIATSGSLKRSEQIARGWLN